MKTFLITIVLVILAASICNAQYTNSPSINALTFELGKNGVIFNLHYDHKIAKKNMGFRLGAGSNFAKYLKATTVGGGGYYLSGKGKHFFEIGLDIQYLIINEISDDQKGFSFVYPEYSLKTFYPSVNLGYRGYGQTMVGRIGFSPGFIKNEFIPGAYIGFGITF